MAKRKNTYDNESISALKGADRVRKRPAVIFGSDGLEGCQHSIFEILSNSIDEAREGFGNRIVITRYSDQSVEVEDFGRGIPVDFNTRENRYNWELVFCELYAGGKYNNADSESYEFSLGLNGLGLCATQYSSEYMDVEVYRDGFRYSLHFEHGENVGGLKKEPTNKKTTGSRIRWRPDLQVFTDINVPLSYYQDIIKRQAIVNEGLTFLLRDQVGRKFEEYTYLYERGIADHVEELAGEEAMTGVQVWQTERQGRDRADKPEYKVKINVALTFSNKVNVAEYYHNSSWLEYGGAPEKAVRSAFVSQIDAYLKQNSKYKQGESKISFQDVADCLIIVISSFSTRTSYENQTKKAITNRFIQEAMTDFLRHQLEVYFIENPLDAEKIAAQVLVNKRSREEAEKLRISSKKKLSGNLDLSNRVEKFVDCRSRDVGVRELYIVEGDSALGACKQARDPDFQAIIPVRGKILNCLKADYNRIFKNDIITDLCKVLGCGVEVHTKANKDLSSFDLGSLRWNKVIICTDADVDGFQIRTLILTMLYRLMPTLIEEGKVFIAESPLYEIGTKDQTYFAYTEQEKAKVLQEIGQERYTIQRSKGLGENEPDMMSLTTMNPATRRLIKVEPDDALQTAAMFDLMLGDNLSGRKDYISQNGAQYLELADLS
ncbi:DNA gyrase subunit B [Eubacteriaceae bacterium CHKCI005]|uniref:DNA topoisomerase (ATP-hydrolyzing) n=1 Tax=Solibaculum mannosilyticum TaxID=2780922 RepID=A0A7I8D5X1_9FIRM|nr:toprim domain-containing protein [Solibaculum mannosilyticum]BCI60879.1 DNA gyrase subunit B [Solibaculum mannosilyticum]CZT55387.1 DNA gyrase subunit B [Eubacteriaceae bacterium CHKCI005]